MTRQLPACMSLVCTSLLQATFGQEAHAATSAARRSDPAAVQATFGQEVHAATSAARRSDPAAVQATFGQAAHAEAPRAVGKLTLAADTTWSGATVLTGDVVVPAGVTLTIAPGAVVKLKKLGPGGEGNLFGTEAPYYPQAEIIVLGRLVAKGTAAQPIVFTSAEASPKAADWGALNFLGGAGNVLEWCRISFAYNGVHAHGAEVAVTACELSDNVVAVSVKKDDEVAGAPGYGKEANLTVRDSLVRDNRGGINVRASRAVISHTTVRGNKFFGIWLKEKCRGSISHNEITGNEKGIFIYRAEGMTISANNLAGNMGYSLAIADEQAQDVPAAGNWFGTTDPLQIRAHIFDHAFDPSVARILFEPFLDAPVADAGRRG